VIGTANPVRVWSERGKPQKVKKGQSDFGNPQAYDVKQENEPLHPNLSKTTFHSL
jgi:hypothetical protein